MHAKNQEIIFRDYQGDNAARKAAIASGMSTEEALRRITDDSIDS